MQVVSIVRSCLLGGGGGGGGGVGGIRKKYFKMSSAEVFTQSAKR